jgi:hypothetical protein
MDTACGGHELAGRVETNLIRATRQQGLSFRRFSGNLRTSPALQLAFIAVAVVFAWLS